MPAPEGFSYERRGSEIAIFHRGRRAASLRGDAAAKFLRKLESGDPQQLMARATGNYKRGNERR